MRPRSITWFLVSAVALLLSACGTAPQPAVNLSSAKVLPSHSNRVWFLPPVGQPVSDSGHVFDPDLKFNIVVFNVDPGTRLASGNALAPSLSTADGSIQRQSGGYHANWKVKTTANDPAAGDYLRLEFRGIGTAAGPVCNDTGSGPGGACFGYLDVHLAAKKGKGGSQPTAGFLDVNPNQTLPLKFKVEQRLAPTTLKALSAVADNEPLNDSLGSCPAGEFNLPSQGLQAVGAGLQAVGAGLQAVGAIGGVFIGNASPTADGAVAPARTIGAQVRTALANGPSANDVAILVVDDFGVVGDSGTSSPYNVPTELLDPDPHLDVEQLFADGNFPHGALVYLELMELVSSAGYDAPDDLTISAESPYLVFTRESGDPESEDGARIVLYAVNTAGSDTEGIAGAINVALQSLLDGVEIDHVVVNMSFAIVPCAVTANYDFTKSTLSTFQDYVKALGVVNGIADAAQPELTKLVATPAALASDPLFAFIDCPLPGVVDGVNTCDGSDGESHGLVSLVNVASSGNYGLGYALYPAAKPSVISVGSEDVSPVVRVGDPDETFPTRSKFSNYAEVLAPGSLVGVAEVGGVTVALAGTSFSAPVVTLLEALDLASGAPHFDAGSVTAGEATPPALAYGTSCGTPYKSLYNVPILDESGTLLTVPPVLCTP